MSCMCFISLCKIFSMHVATFVWCCLLITFANTLDPDQDQMLVLIWIQTFLTLWYCFWKNFKVSQRQKAWKLPSMQRVKLSVNEATTNPLVSKRDSHTGYQGVKFHFLRSHRFAYQEYDLNLIHISDTTYFPNSNTVCVYYPIIFFAFPTRHLTSFYHLKTYTLSRPQLCL